MLREGMPSAEYPFFPEQAGQPQLAITAMSLGGLQPGPHVDDGKSCESLFVSRAALPVPGKGGMMEDRLSQTDSEVGGGAATPGKLQHLVHPNQVPTSSESWGISNHNSIDFGTFEAIRSLHFENWPSDPLGLRRRRVSWTRFSPNCRR